VSQEGIGFLSRHGEPTPAHQAADQARATEDRPTDWALGRQRLVALQAIAVDLAAARTPADIGRLVLGSGTLLLDASTSRIRMLRNRSKTT
jgi:hypothetical protein